jgi:hypothetical protein
MCWLKCLLLVLATFQLSIEVNSVGIEDLEDYQRYKKEENLLNDLLTGYNPLILPTLNNSESVKVH